MLDQSDGFIAFLVQGAGAEAAVRDEAGGHRWQRVPPTERRGRVQSSTVTVAVLEVDASVQAGPAMLNERDVTITATRGSGPGGQHRNVTDSCVLAVHRPTGLQVRIDGRSQIQNRKLALAILASKLRQQAAAQGQDARNQARRSQVGTGERSDKIRTYRVRDDLVIDHRSGQRWKLSAWIRGEV